jgi:N-acetylglucosaminyldiphosphoundecaprenol N-acetyl-beta-D-mannosaminyltransferase
MTSESTILTPSYRVPPTVTPSVTMDDALLPPPLKVGGVLIHPIGADDVLAWMAAMIANGGRGRVSYANAYNVLLAKDLPTYHAALEQSDVVFCDGFGVWGASRWLGTPLPERMTLPDWSERLFALANREGWSLFFLGAETGIAERAAHRLQARYPNLTIHTHHGYFNVENEENDGVLAEINRVNPTLLLVGMGPPRQDLWIHANYTRHHVPMTMAVGCLFDYMAGTPLDDRKWWRMALAAGSGTPSALAAIFAG